MIQTINKIDSIEIPELSIFRTLKQQHDHRRDGLFVAEGHFVVERLLQSPFRIRSVLFTQFWLETFRSELEKRPEKIDVFIGGKEELSKITGYELHQFIMACAEIPQATTIDEIIGASKSPQLMVALDGLTSSDNVGLVLRSCAAFGVHALIAGETSADPWLRRAVRKSMGNVFRVPVIYTDSLVNTIKKLRYEYGFEVFSAQVTNESVPLYAVSLKNSCCIVMGNEGSGVSQEVLEVCSKTLYIPMEKGVDSLNVSSAAAIILSEVVRQRNWCR
ncbi:MAG TPA: RNA methyltransferase [Chitinispirillaceae bacterium]|nr:RNA methyltransferase [Chitinispirillaceae bacterium]